MLSQIVLLLLLGSVLGTANVEITEFFGKVQFEQGISQSIECTVENGEENGVITWRLGGRVLDSQQEELDIETENSVEEDYIAQILTFIPSIEDDGQSLICEYSVPGTELLENDSVHLVVFQQSLEATEPQPAGEGEETILTVEGTIYPKPNMEDFIWRVQDRDGKMIMEMSPGKKDGGYEAKNIQDLGDNRYIVEFYISSMSREKAENRFSLTLTSQLEVMEVTKKLDLNPSYLMDPPKDQVKPPPVINEPSPSEDPEATTSNFGLFIIIGVLLLVIILCIIFCIIRRRRKEPRQLREVGDGKPYSAVSTKDPQPQAV